MSQFSGGNAKEFQNSSESTQERGLINEDVGQNFNRRIMMDEVKMATAP